MRSSGVCFRKLLSENKVPVIKPQPIAVSSTLSDCEFTGGSGSTTAIENTSKLNIVNLTSSGYGTVIKNR